MPRALPLLLLTLLLTACGTPTRYHIIDTATLPADPGFTRQDRLYALRDTDLPDYLNKQYVIHRDENGALVIDKSQLWGEAFPDNLRRVLGEMLGQRTASNNIYLYPLQNNIRPERIIDIQISEMLADYREKAVIVRAKWQISDAGERKPQSSHDFTRRYPLTTPDADAIVAAYRQILTDLSAAILPTL